ncbi:MAG: FkbM family methyltransferase [Bacteroidetes bacterium]|nr:FkbM family methyltransferase [Bacteroidota bacterium]
MKRFLKRILAYTPIALTRNQKYDLLTRRVIKKVCEPTSNCVDVGCHKGEILDLMLKAAPSGRHWGFEPIPELYEALKRKYHGQQTVVVSDAALSDRKGMSSFNYVVTNPSYSGLVKREYDRPNEQDTNIYVPTARMDEVIPLDQKVDLIKIDVEGGELLVLKGASRILSASHPVVIFEHGLGASDRYGVQPEDVFRFFAQHGYSIFNLEQFLKGSLGLVLQEFKEQYWKKKNFYFVAAVPA